MVVGVVVGSSEARDEEAVVVAVVMVVGVSVAVELGGTLVTDGGGGVKVVSITPPSPAQVVPSGQQPAWPLSPTTQYWSAGQPPDWSGQHVKSAGMQPSPHRCRPSSSHVSTSPASFGYSLTCRPRGRRARPPPGGETSRAWASTGRTLTLMPTPMAPRRMDLCIGPWVGFV